MMVAGGFVEGLLISTGALKVKMNNQEISSGLYEQIYSYDNTIKMLEVFKDNKDVGEVLTTFKSVNDVIQEAIHTHGRLTLDNVHNLNAAMTNIKSKLISDISKGRSYKIYVGKRNYYVIEKVYQKYNDVPVGEATALFVCDSLLSISMNQGSASSLMGISLNDIIRIEFYD